MDVQEAYDYLDEVFETEPGMLDGFYKCVSFEIVKVDPELEEITGDPDRDTAIRFWFEGGPFENGFATHDISLDAGGATFEDGLLNFVKNVKKVYGKGLSVMSREVTWRGFGRDYSMPVVEFVTSILKTKDAILWGHWAEILVTFDGITQSCAEWSSVIEKYLTEDELDAITMREAEENPFLDGSLSIDVAIERIISAIRDNFSEPSTIEAVFEQLFNVTSVSYDADGDTLNFKYRKDLADVIHADLGEV